MSFDLYRVQGTAGNVGTPGAPILQFAVLVHGSTGKISGQATITQAVAPPGGNIAIDNVTGQVRKLGLGFGPVTQVVALEGTYDESGPPPTNYIAVRQFRAHFATDAQWNGSGGFEFGGQSVEKVPVKNATSNTGPIHTLYGVVIHDAAASGDIARMKDIAAQAERHLAATPAVQAALTALKAEIAKAP